MGRGTRYQPEQVVNLLRQIVYSASEEGYKRPFLLAHSGIPLRNVADVQKRCSFRVGR